MYILNYPNEIFSENTFLVSYKGYLVQQELEKIYSIERRCENLKHFEVYKIESQK